MYNTRIEQKTASCKKCEATISMPRNQFEATIAVGRFTRLHSCCVGKLTWELRSDIDSLCDELLA